MKLLPWRWFLVLVALNALLAFAVLHIPSQAAAASNDPDFGEVDRYVRQELSDRGLPGAALVVVYQDRIVHMQGYGSADSSGRAVTPQTPFVLGSTTKSFTGLAVMQLVEAGLLELNAPVQRYLPWFRVGDPAASAEITVRQLLNHTSGISTYTGRAGLERTDSRPDALERYVRDLAAAQPQSAPGSRFAYSNANYSILGLLIEKVSGQSYEQYVQEHIFDPLQMKHSYTAPAAARADGGAIGHRIWLGRPLPFPAAPYPRHYLPAGYLSSTAEDMGHYLIAQLNAGRYETAAVLSPDGVVAMHSPGVEISQGGSYGMGWGLKTSTGSRVLGHSGDLSDYHSDMFLLPDEKWAVAMLFNTNTTLSTSAGAISAIAAEVTRMVSQQPIAEPPLPSNELYFGLMGFSLLLFLMEAVLAVLAGRALWRWQRDPASRPVGVWPVVRSVILPLVPDVLVVAFYYGMLPILSQTPLPVFLVYQPDLGALIVAGLALAIGWGIARTALGVWMILRRTAAQVPHSASGAKPQPVS